MVAQVRYVVAASASALGAPALLITLRALEVGPTETSRWLAAEVARQPDVFVCFALLPLLLVVLAGHVVGRLVDQLEATALHDGLTGLWNRRYAEGRLDGEVSRALRDGRPLSLLLIDVDRLKAINDRGGHSAGDHALRSVAAAVASSCRRSDVPVRWGGDEFVVLAPSTAALDALNLGERIRAQVAGAGFSVSIGIAELGPLGTPESLLAAADCAVYRAKDEGRDRISSTDVPVLRVARG